jgi:broad specificity phosphatase PhoE
MKLILLRHCDPLSVDLGEDDQVIPDRSNGLTAYGREKAAKVGDHIRKNYGNLKIISSPLLRARETAEIVALKLGVSVKFDPRLEERNFGFTDETTYKESMMYQLESYSAPDARNPGGECIRDHRARVEDWCHSLYENMNGDGDLLVVSHGGTMEHIHCIFQHSDVDSMAFHYTSCECGNYNAWESIFEKPIGLVWRLDKLNCEM